MSSEIPFTYAIRQAIYIGCGVFAGMLVFRLRLVDLERLGVTLLLSAFAMLLLVLVPGVGVEVNGASRWVNAGLFRLQVSEPAKLFFIIYLASYLARHGDEVRSHISGFLKPIRLAGNCRRACCCWSRISAQPWCWLPSSWA